MSNTELPLNTGACEWVLNRKRPGRDSLSEVEQEMITVLCAAFGTGPWNIHADWSIMRLVGFGVRMSVRSSLLNTFDTDGLTRLVFAAHDRCCRLEVDAGGPHRVTIKLWKRAREGSRARRHPTLEAAVDDWKLYTLARNS